MSYFIYFCTWLKHDNNYVYEENLFIDHTNPIG